MAKVTANSKLGEVRSWEELRRYADIVISQIVDIINGRIAFGDNLDGAIVNLEFTSANQELPANHNLNRIASRYIVIKRSAALTVYDGTTQSSLNTTFLKSSAAGNCSLFIF